MKHKINIEKIIVKIFLALILTIMGIVYISIGKALITLYFLGGK